MAVAMPEPDASVLQRRERIAAQLRRIVPGEGVIDLVAFFGALKEIGYADGVSPEVFGRGLKNLPPEEPTQVTDKGLKIGLPKRSTVMDALRRVSKAEPRS